MLVIQPSTIYDL